MKDLNCKKYFAQIKKKYPKSSKHDKTLILNEFCRLCGYNRKYAIRLLQNKKYTIKKKPSLQAVGRPKIYSSLQILEFLLKLRRISNLVCSKRLKHMINLWLPFYEDYFSVTLPDSIKKLLGQISPATIDRLLHSHYKKFSKLGFATTKPGTILRDKIAIKTEQWNEKKVGFFEADTVAHCGGSLSGTFIYTLNVVDIASGWIETRALWGKGQHSTVAAIKNIEENLPFKILGFDTDNGSEFINWHLYDYFDKRKRKINFTRTRPYKKNDNAHIENKNYTHIRQYLGYSRFESKEILDLLNELFIKDWSLFFNYFIPSMKLIDKKRIKSKIIKIHDYPKTPFQRVLESDNITKKVKIGLKKTFKSLNPFKLQKNIEKVVKMIKMISPNFEESKIRNS